MGAIRLTTRLITGVARAIAIAVGVVLFGGGVPFAWIWVGSQLQGGTPPSLAGLGVALAGIIVTYWLLAAVFAWIVQRSRRADEPVRYAWNRSLRDERHRPGQTTHAPEEVVITATILVGIACTIAFFLFGDPGTPVGT
jgi:hypothetical protein